MNERLHVAQTNLLHQFSSFRITPLDPLHQFSSFRIAHLDLDKDGNVQECNSDKCMCILTLPSAWASFAPKLTSTLTDTMNQVLA